jgi:methylenetetrahydrofolate reductase (NADPH)
MDGKINIVISSNNNQHDNSQYLSNSPVEKLLKGYSIEVTPRTAEKVDNFRSLLPKDTLIYIAHIEGTSIEDMLRTAKRIALEGYPVMPHFPARIIKDKLTLSDWIDRYQGEAGVEKALLLAGSQPNPCGDFENSIQLMETGFFDKAGFTHLHVAGHPEGNRDIDPDGTNKNVHQAMLWKQTFNARTNAKIALTTQFSFKAETIISWADSIKAAGVDLPINIGIVGPARLQTLIKFAITCGVGPSLKILQKRAMDLTKLLLPYDPYEIISLLAEHKMVNPDINITNVHFFPLGGIRSNANWANKYGGLSGIPADIT